jgi:hypothetical protein
MNARAERFNRTIQESFVDYPEELLFTDLALFNRKLADWLVFYNAERPYHSLSQQSPLSFLLEHQPECQRYYWTHTNFAPGFEGHACLLLRASSENRQHQLAIVAQSILRSFAGKLFASLQNDGHPSPRLSMMWLR